MTDALTATDTAYERAEADFLSAVRSRSERADLRIACGAVAEAAADWNTLAYERLHQLIGDERAELDPLTERTEVLSELWAERGTVPASGVQSSATAMKVWV